MCRWQNGPGWPEIGLCVFSREVCWASYQSYIVVFQSGQALCASGAILHQWIVKMILQLYDIKIELSSCATWVIVILSFEDVKTTLRRFKVPLYPEFNLLQENISTVACESTSQKREKSILYLVFLSLWRNMFQNVLFFCLVFGNIGLNILSYIDQ